MKYSEVSNMNFSQALQKIAAAPTHGGLASAIHKTLRTITQVQEDIRKDYRKDLMEVYGKRDADGKLVLNPQGDIDPDESREEEYELAAKEFSQKTVSMPVQAFTPQMIENVRISPQDLQMLGAMYTGNMADEVEKPSLASVK